MEGRGVWGKGKEEAKGKEGKGMVRVNKEWEVCELFRSFEVVCTVRVQNHCREYQNTYTHTHTNIHAHTHSRNSLNHNINFWHKITMP